MSQGHELDCSLDISHLSTACTPLVSDEHFLTTSTMHNTCTLVSKTIQCCDTCTSEEFIIPNDNYYSYRMLHTDNVTARYNSYQSTVRFTMILHGKKKKKNSYVASMLTTIF